ncbi:FecR domain-containing protein [Chitinophaga niabensis]|uniref:FecR domain-containing protein n=1 Tax=Chitinophaga niabensis TaxID=536979 RepID=UPI0031BA8CC2
MITQALLERFLKNECTAAERQLILRYIEEHPGAVEQLLPEHEFEAEHSEPDIAQSEHLYRSLHHTLFRRKTIIRRLKWGVAAAACIALVISLFLIGAPGKKATQLAVSEEGNGMLKMLNTGTGKMMFTLPDSSTVELNPGSSVEYRNQFMSTKNRIVYLKGTGLFNVSQNASHPFTVMSDALATTVLGTSFIVTAEEQADVIKVHLLTGKVVVQSSDSRKDYYLQPGDLLTYNKHTFLASVRSTTAPEFAEASVTTGSKGKASLKPDWYNFGGQPLTQVFEQLSSYYGIEINYLASEVSNRYFTGKFSDQDSVDVILKDISLMHDLSLKKVQGVYIMRKKK